MVGNQITKLNPIRSFCVAASTAFTVILASWMGLPLSTTHVAVGAVFGIGFFREFQNRQQRRKNAKRVQLAPEDRHRRRLVRTRSQPFPQDHGRLDDHGARRCNLCGRSQRRSSVVCLIRGEARVG